MFVRQLVGLVQQMNQSAHPSSCSSPSPLSPLQGLLVRAAWAYRSLPSLPSLPQGLLVRAARAYRSLLATVLRCGLELPFEADLLNNGGLLVEGRWDTA